MQNEEFSETGRQQLLHIYQYGINDRSAKEDVKQLIRMAPIWAASLMCGVVSAQSATFFTKQASTMNTRISPHFKIPPAALQTIIFITGLILLPPYDRVFVPLARKFTGEERGISLLQRIGVGLFLCTVTIALAALTEAKRLAVAEEHGLVDMPHATIPITVFWLFPQYILLGTSNIFTSVGLQEFCYDQMPQTMGSLAIAVSFSVNGLGGFLSTILISVAEKFTGIGGQETWFVDNLNRSHLNYFYWFLAGLSALNLCVYVYSSSCYSYRKNVQSSTR